METVHTQPPLWSASGGHGSILQIQTNFCQAFTNRPKWVINPVSRLRNRTQCGLIQSTLHSLPLIVSNQFQLPLFGGGMHLSSVRRPNSNRENHASFFANPLP